MESELIERAISEIEHPTLDSTKEYLEVHSVRVHYNTPKVDRIDVDSFEDAIAVYFPIVDEGFLMVVHFWKDTQELHRVTIENSNRAYITATSTKLNFDQLAATTESFAWKGWSRGELMPNGRSKYYYSRVTFGPMKSSAYTLNTALKFLLEILEKDIPRVRKLAKIAEAQIGISRDLYISSDMGFRIERDTITRINNLHLSIDLEQYVSGNELKDEE